MKNTVYDQLQKKFLLCKLNYILKRNHLNQQRKFFEALKVHLDLDRFQAFHNNTQFSTYLNRYHGTRKRSPVSLYNMRRSAQQFNNFSNLNLSDDITNTPRNIGQSPVDKSFKVIDCSFYTDQRNRTFSHHLFGIDSGCEEVTLSKRLVLRTLTNDQFLKFYKEKHESKVNFDKSPKFENSTSSRTDSPSYLQSPEIKSRVFQALENKFIQIWEKDHQLKSSKNFTCHKIIIAKPSNMISSLPLPKRTMTQSIIIEPSKLKIPYNKNYAIRQGIIQLILTILAVLILIQFSL